LSMKFFLSLYDNFTRNNFRAAVTLSSFINLFNESNKI